MSFGQGGGPGGYPPGPQGQGPYGQPYGQPYGAPGPVVVQPVINISNNNVAQAYAGPGVVAVMVDQRRMHWVYFCLVGWWLGFCVAGMIFPLFFESGRRLTAAAFGYW